VRAYLVGLVPKEVYFLEALARDVLQGVGLVPSVGKDIERDLPADGVGDPVVGEFVLQDLDERGAEPVLLSRTESVLRGSRASQRRTDLVVRLELVPFGYAGEKIQVDALWRLHGHLRRVTADGADIDHPVPEFDKSPAEMASDL
jgi:hypothetical protein